MNRHCLICESTAMLTCEAAAGLALLVGLLGAALRSAQRTNRERVRPGCWREARCCALSVEHT